MTETSPPSLAEVAAELAPRGRLRAALNHGNVVLVRRGMTEDTPTGVSVDLARALAERMELPIDFVHFDRAADVSASAEADVWDLCFLAIDPKRSTAITFSEPYVAIDGAFLVPAGSRVKEPEEVDRLALRVGVVKASAYALHLERTAQGLRLVLFESPGEAANALVNQDVDGLAGVRQAMEGLAMRRPGLRVIEKPFMTILQAVGVPAGRPAAAAYVRRFVDELKSTGFVTEALVRSEQHGVPVP